MGGTIKWPYNNSECLDADFFKVVADHLVTSSGIRPLLHSFAVDVIMEDDTIKGIIMESKSGRRAILVDRIIDCTGDADIAHLAGAEYRVTDKKDRMGMTTVLNAAGVDKERFVDYTEEPSHLQGLVSYLGPGDNREGGQPEEPLPRHGI